MGKFIEVSFSKLLSNCSSSIILDYLHDLSSFVNHIHDSSLQYWSHEKALKMQQSSAGYLTCEEVVSDYQRHVIHDKHHFKFECIVNNDLYKQIWLVDIFCTKIPHIDWRLVNFAVEHGLHHKITELTESLLHNDFATTLDDFSKGTLTGGRVHLFLLYKIDKIRGFRNNYYRVPSVNQNSMLEDFKKKINKVLSPCRNIITLSKDDRTLKCFAEACDRDLLANWGESYLETCLGQLNIRLKQWLSA